MLEPRAGFEAAAISLTLVAVTAQTLANFGMSVGLRQLSSARSWGQRCRTFLRRPWLGLALILLTVHFFSWCKALTLAPLALIVPLTAFTHVLNAALVGPLLGEVVTRQRWLGTAVIVAGILVVVV